MRGTILFALVCLLAACVPAAQEATPEPPTAAPATETPAVTATPSPRATLPPEPTATETFTPSASPTLRPTRTLEASETPIPTATLTLTPSVTLTPSDMPVPTDTSEPTLTPSASPTISFTPQERSAVAQRTPVALLPFGGQFRYVTHGLSVGFLDVSRGQVDSWSWEFGDGATSTLRSPNHRYAAPGRYLVRLTVTGAGGASRVARVIELEPPVCYITARGRARMYNSPSQSSQTLVLWVEGAETAVREAVIGADGNLWYLGSDPVRGWILASQARVLRGICPEPPP